jgi:hypothetical protein
MEPQLLDIPRRFKALIEHTPRERAAVDMASSQGLPVPKFETVKYREHKASVLHAAGLHSEASELENAYGPAPSPSDLTVEDHFHRVKAAPPGQIYGAQGDAIGAI